MVKRGDEWGRGIRQAMVGGGAIAMLLPLGVVWMTSMRTPQGAWTIDFYPQAWQQAHLGRAFINSLLVAGSVTVLQVATAAIAGYALARLKFRGQRMILGSLVATLAIPLQLLVIPIFLVLKWGHLVNTYGALILPTAASGYSIFWLRQFFLTLPPELEEAAALDGATRWQTLWWVLLPLARPALSTLALLVAIAEWNDLFKPLVFTTRPELQTVQLAIAGLQEQFTNNWSLLMAAVTLASVPILLLFLLVQRQLIRGISTTGLKR